MSANPNERIGHSIGLLLQKRSIVAESKYRHAHGEYGERKDRESKIGSLRYLKDEKKQEDTEKDRSIEHDSVEDDPSEDGDFSTDSIVSEIVAMENESSAIPEALSNTGSYKARYHGPLYIVGAAAIALIVVLVASRRRKNRAQHHSMGMPDTFDGHDDPELDNGTVASSCTNLSNKALCAGWE